MRDLTRCGITAIRFAGEKQILNTHVVGKGCVGIVVIAYRNGEKLALKIRRVDADRCSMKHEAKLLRKANSLSIGPTLLNASRDFLLMQFIEGELLPIWLEKRHSRAKVREILREILEQCYRLDKAGLDHGELSHAPKHVLVDDEDRPFVVDFETASLNRRPANVTSMCQFLFVGGAIAEQVAKKLGGTNKELILESLRRYKNDRSYENFQSVLKACGV